MGAPADILGIQSKSADVQPWPLPTTDYTRISLRFALKELVLVVMRST
jgi:hypothetical protein